MEPPVLAPVSEEVTEALEPELLDDDDEEMSTERADSEMIDEDALLSDEPAKMEVEVAKQEVSKNCNLSLVFTREYSKFMLRCFVYFEFLFLITFSKSLITITFHEFSHTFYC